MHNLSIALNILVCDIKYMHYRHYASHYCLDDVVVRMHLVSLVRAATGTMHAANQFRGNEQTLDMVVYRKDAESDAQ